MKKYLLSAFVIALFSNFSYANTNDISSIIFEQSSSIDDIIVSNQATDAVNKSDISLDTKNEIDEIIQKALDNANKKEAEIQEKKKIETEKKQNESKKYEKTKISNNEITEYAHSLLGVPYVWGGNTIKGFDCSGFVKSVFNKFDISIARTTYDQIKQGKSVNLGNIEENDLIFFDTRSISLLKKKSKENTNRLEDIVILESEITDNKLYPTIPTHVGIYIGNGKFIHASSSKRKTVIEKLDSDYFKNRIVDVRRYI